MLPTRFLFVIPVNAIWVCELFRTLLAHLVPLFFFLSSSKPQMKLARGGDNKESSDEHFARK